ncbi:hypothetical protein GCM10009530_65270 [Microbispora corallina]|uniref:Major facilitator superfamily (MFS) profile domain-containing protein n=1 Tax=Microbispora corallina TaxID=83302 RepID=A0ABQ4G9D4_9ACTN|nr:hypothetical protein Mco01_66290 [Microbispora corallina]
MAPVTRTVLLATLFSDIGMVSFSVRFRLFGLALGQTGRPPETGRSQGDLFRRPAVSVSGRR